MFKTVIAIALLLSISILTNCSPKNTIKSQEFLDSIEAVFKGGGGTAYLSSFTNFDWDQVCYFHWGDSIQFGVKREYEHFVKENPEYKVTNLNINKDYMSFFIFFYEAEVAEIIGIMDSRINIEGATHNIYKGTVKEVAHNSPEGRCLGENALLSKRTIYNKDTLKAKYGGIKLSQHVPEQSSSLRNDASSQYEEAMIYYKDKNFSMARLLLEKSANQNYDKAQYRLGYLYDYGKGVKQNHVIAKGWYLKAAEQGYMRAQHNLGHMLEHGDGVKKNSRLARVWYRKAALNGYSKSLFNLGLMYEMGRGGNKDFSKALSLYQKAGKKNHKKALNNIGWMYQSGLGVDKSYAEAYKWYKKSADLGHPKANINLARMYEKGIEVGQSYKEARKYYQEAAIRGNAYAQYRLANLYLIGEGGDTDFKTAYLWFYLAAERGNLKAKLGRYILEKGFSSEYLKKIKPYSEKYHKEVEAYYNKQRAP